MVLYLFIMSLLATSVNCAWDLAVLTSTSLEFLGQEMSPVSMMPLGMRNVSALTYDPLYLHHYFSSTGHPNASIFRIQVSRDGRTGPIEPLVKKQPGRVYGLAYDAESTTVFWTLKQQILRSQLDLGLTDGEVVHNFDDTERPRAIAVEPCSRYIYWSYNLYNIDRSLMDGSQKERIVEGLFVPVAITISQKERRIYWVDEGPGYSYRVGRALLDGSNKEIILDSMDQQPTSLVVRHSAQGSVVFWTDRISKKLWSLKENSTEPSSMKSFDQPILAVASADSFQHLDKHVCSQLIVMRDQVPYMAIAPTAGACVHGTFSALSASCICTPGYIGTLCETSICYNYCLNGTCSMISGRPACRCPPGRTGQRCETDACRGFCHQGACDITTEGKLTCSCSPGWYGQRCNISTEFCSFACSNNLPQQNDCVCNVSISAALSASMGNLFNYKLGFIISVTSCGLMSLCLVLLLVKNWRLGKRPRVRRHYTVTPNMKGSTPSYARTSPDCEIPIENCCNMNICDTPCYEPEVRPPTGRNKKEEKRGLLGEMEVQPDSGDTF